MLIVQNFELYIEEYLLRGRENDFPMIDQYPFCSARRLLHRPSFHKRNGLMAEKEFEVEICRLICPSKNVVHHSELSRTVSTYAGFSYFRK